MVLCLDFQVRLRSWKLSNKSPLWWKEKKQEEKKSKCSFLSCLLFFHSNRLERPGSQPELVGMSYITFQFMYVFLSGPMRRKEEAAGLSSPAPISELTLGLRIRVRISSTSFGSEHRRTETELFFFSHSRINIHKFLPSPKALRRLSAWAFISCCLLFGISVNTYGVNKKLSSDKIHFALF